MFGYQPYGAGLSFTHFFALGIEKQGNCHSMSVLAQLSADQFCTAKHVAPLVVSSKLHVTAIFLEQHVEVIALHDHVVKFQET